MYATCCPHYTIRLRVADFKPNKSQRQLCRKIERYLATGDVHVALTSTSTEINLKKDTNKDTDEDTTTVDSKVIDKKESKLTMETVTAEVTDEVFELYKKYQVSVNKDKPDTITQKGFKRFLVDSPLIRGVNTVDGSGVESKPLGTHHQCHRLDGKLIAVGVVDLLPVGLSSVYLFYDPDYRELVLGKYTALEEISYCLNNDLEYYFMGYYIHDCDKMKYKAEYAPSELLCPTTMKFFPFTECKPMLDNSNSEPFLFTPFDAQFRAIREKMGVLDSDEKILYRKKQKREEMAKTKEGEGNDDDVEDESEDEDNATKAVDIVMQHPLRAMRQRFQGMGKVNGDTMWFELHGSMIQPPDLREPGRSNISAILSELACLVGPDMIKKLKVVL
jgi:arginyl-tRNA--protein-N-Asp/Glu arginylyltransferase